MDRESKKAGIARVMRSATSTRALGILIAVGALLSAALIHPNTANAAASKNYGKPGEPIELVIGYQPYYTESWSGVIMRDKKFYEKHLPKGSTVTFQIGLQGAIIVNGMIAGKVDIGYVGDMPAIVSTSHADVRDIRIVSVLGLGYDQCNIFLTRTDAPKFNSPDEALKWLDGKTFAVPKGSCTDRFAQAVFKEKNIKPSEYLNQSIEVITSGFRAKKLDAAVIWEPTASRLVLDNLARQHRQRCFRQRARWRLHGDAAGFDRTAARRRQGMAGSRARCRALFRRSKNSMEVARMAASQTTGFPEKALWSSAYGQTAKSEGGTDTRITLAYGFTPEAKELIQKASKFLVEIKSIKAEIRPEAVMSQFTDEILKARNLKAPVGEVKALPGSAYTGK